MGEKLSGELSAPPDAALDPRALEMIRAWIINKRLQVSLNVGVWSKDPSHSQDERLIWGILLADVARHVANALEKSADYDRRESIELIRDQFNGEIDRPTSDHPGDFVNKK